MAGRIPSVPAESKNLTIPTYRTIYKVLLLYVPKMLCGTKHHHLCFAKL